ncbi:hypothetical protein C8J56DRAFT_889355 [Mycena floridula]|nr:hypothetical protein C8J56DRAFT_889355 [Mycena floridula]
MARRGRSVYPAPRIGISSFFVSHFSYSGGVFRPTMVSAFVILSQMVYPDSNPDSTSMPGFKFIDTLYPTLDARLLWYDRLNIPKENKVGVNGCSVEQEGSFSLLSMGSGFSSDLRAVWFKKLNTVGLVASVGGSLHQYVKYQWASYGLSASLFAQIASLILAGWHISSIPRELGPEDDQVREDGTKASRERKMKIIISHSCKIRVSDLILMPNTFGLDNRTLYDSSIKVQKAKNDLVIPKPIQIRYFRALE